jgi:putative membrane protein
MLAFFINWIALSFALIVTAFLVPKFEVKSFGSALLAVAVIGLFNALLHPILWLLTLPINILTLGLFTFVINAIILRIAAGVLKGFDIHGWLPAILGAVVLSLVQAIMAYWGFIPATA